ncbi:hypothetical protein PSHT_16177 [Puccinia striiformis]|uniref:Uncharacterized protein n=1 Tax=Puccinia striiformis TaxID=27350 RepID=A0A2S4UB47_9BASI|nr:hypothetical protein PSHT_16177 [Puccinia striiformis]
MTFNSFRAFGSDCHAPMLPGLHYRTRRARARQMLVSNSALDERRHPSSSQDHQPNQEPLGAIKSIRPSA